MRDRLIELVCEAKDLYPTIPLVNGCKPSFEVFVADHILANGVIAPPCKVGDKVFGVVPKYDAAKGRVKYEVSDIEIKDLTYRLPDGLCEALFLAVGEMYEQCGTFGKTVFLTREEVEAALKGRESNGRK